MKFLAAFTLLVAAGVTAQDKNCEAEYIVSRCLKTETDKVTSPPLLLLPFSPGLTNPPFQVGACNQTDLDCLCAAYQAVAT